MAQQTQRRYVLTRISKGDYIVPSNDGTRLLRITSYPHERDVPIEGGEWKVVTSTAWRADHYHLTVQQMHARYGDDIPADFLDWDQWEYLAGGYGSRRECIEDVIDQ